MARTAHPTWLGTAGADWAPDIVIVAVDVPVRHSAILIGEKSSGVLDPIAAELSARLDSAASEQDLVAGLDEVEDRITSALQADYTRDNPPKLYSADELAADSAAGVRRFQLLLLPVTGVVLLGIIALIESRRHRSGSATGGSGWFDGDFDDGGD